MQNTQKLHDPLSLEDRLRGMIVSHQHRQEAQPSQNNHNTQPNAPNTTSNYITAGYPSSYLPPGFAAARTMPVPFPLQFHQLKTSNPHIRGATYNERSENPKLQLDNKEHSHYTQGYKSSASSHTIHRQHPSSVPAPPPANLDHPRHLDKEFRKESARCLRGAQIQRPGQEERAHTRPENQAAKPYNWHYERFYPEQASNLDRLARETLVQITPPESETTSKRQLLDRLSRICKKLSPTSELAPFGSLVTGFATVSSDIDCIFSPGQDIAHDTKSPDITADLPSLLESLLQEEGFEAELLSRTRVPIIKMVQRATSEYPQELQCDIGFKNHLAIHNTQLLLGYSRCDTRVKQMVLFIKWWAKKRHINSPYRGTLSSYGYVLMTLHYLINIAQPPVLPNLQLHLIPDDTDNNELFYWDGDNKYDIWFFKDIAAIGTSANTDSCGELLRGFFEYYAYKFQWGQSVISIRTESGILSKQDKGWITAKTRLGGAADSGETWEVKDRFLFAVEDPFEIAHNVGRTCNGPGVGRIRNELRRAMTLIKLRDHGKTLSQCLFEEAPPDMPFVRKEDKTPIAPDVHKQDVVAARSENDTK